MKQLFVEHNEDDKEIIAAYAEAEKRGLVSRKSNEYNFSPEQYARALYNDGIRKGWITDSA